MRCALEALTDEARHALGGLESCPVETFPFRVGRECREGHLRQAATGSDRRAERQQPNNECYLIDQGEHTQVAREHFQIERDDTGRTYLVDRGSATGTIVDGQALGPHAATTWIVLEPGMTIHVGTRISPYRYRFVSL